MSRWGAPYSIQRQHELTLTHRSQGGRRRLRRQLAARRSKQGRGGRIEAAVYRGDGQRQLEVRISGDANVRTHQPAGLGLEDYIGTRPQFLGRRDFYQMDGMSRITIVDQRGQLEAMRHGPDDVACREPGRQLPGQGGRLTRIPGIAPIRVPAVPNLEFKSHPDGLARANGAGLRDQPRLDIVCADGLARER